MKMKSTGMSRAIDPLGRVVIPKEIRTALDWNDGDPLSIFVEGDRVILRKETPVCVFCGSTEPETAFHGKPICTKCLNELKYN